MEGPRRAEDTSNLSDVPTAPGALPRISRSKSSWSVTLSRLPPSEISPTPQSTKCTLCPSCTPSSTTACLAPFTPRSSMDDLGRRERTGRRPQDSGPSRIKYRNDKHGARDLSIGKHCCYTYELDRLQFIRKHFFVRVDFSTKPRFATSVPLWIVCNFLWVSNPISFVGKEWLSIWHQNPQVILIFDIIRSPVHRFGLRFFHACFESEKKKIMFLNLFWVLKSSSTTSWASEIF